MQTWKGKKKESTRQDKTYKEALMTNNEVEAARVSGAPPTFTA